ncbi:MAG: hypothetical protein VSS52_009250 [Thiotrichaceae bacterium]|nr:hypothetical protein [Thiotrichaceae bacterium]
MSYLQTDEAKELIIKPISSFPDDVYSDEAVDEILYQTRGHPYLIQFLCLLVIDQLNKEKRRPATCDDVLQQKQVFFKAGLFYFNELWNTTLQSEKERAVLGKIVQKNFEQLDKKIVRSLINKEIIEVQHDVYRFQIPLIEEFITEKLEEEGFI